MGTTARGIVLLRDSIEVVRRRLAALPASSEVEALVNEAEGYMREVDAWAKSRSTREQGSDDEERAAAAHRGHEDRAGGREGVRRQFPPRRPIVAVEH